MGHKIDLERCRILVIEDDYFLALGIVHEVEDHNGVVLSPVATLEQGFAAVQYVTPDACILNIQLGPDMVYPSADLLIERCVPFVFASAEPRDTIPRRFDHVPLLLKPLQMVKAAETLMQGGLKRRV